MPETLAEVLRLLRQPITVDVGRTSYRSTAFLSNENGALICVNPIFQQIEFSRDGRVLYLPGSFNKTGLPNQTASKVEMNMLLSHQPVEETADHIRVAIHEARRIARPTATVEIIDGPNYLNLVRKIYEDEGLSCTLLVPDDELLRQRTENGISMRFSTNAFTTMQPKLLIVQL